MNFGTGLTIKWWHGIVEHIHIDPTETNPPPNPLPTVEWWPDAQRWVGYQAEVEKFSISDGQVEIILRYRKEKQSDPYAKKQNSYWGTSEIKWRIGAPDGAAEWTDDEPNDPHGANGPAGITITYDGDRQVRERKQTTVKSRPQQQIVRSYLISIVGRCELTRETQVDALDAAHIEPTGKECNETINNMMLLRADLHRLFDAGLFGFDVSDRTAKVWLDNGLSPTYQKKLAGMKLEPDTFGRVSAALQKEFGPSGSRYRKQGS